MDVDPQPMGAGGARNAMLIEEQFEERVRFFVAFLDDRGTTEVMSDMVITMVKARLKRLIVSIDDLRNYNRAEAFHLLKTPIDYLPPFEKALKDYIKSLDTALFNEPGTPITSRITQADIEQTDYHVGLTGSFGDHAVNTRTLSSSHLGKIISIEGIVTKCSLVRPKVVRSVHYCEETQLYETREYRDHTFLGAALPTPALYPKADAQGNRLTTEFGFCTYRDYQTISIQEMPERAPAGQLPRPLEVVFDDDLVDLCKPGDRVCIVAVYRSVGKGGTSVSGNFRTMLLALNVTKLTRSDIKIQPLEWEIREFRRLAKRPDIFELLSQSLAPSIFNTTNMKFIKKAVLMQLLGGMERNLDNGAHIRGDINILLIGDPSTAKSQMLRFVYNTAPLAIATTGRGSSGVGLTAAVTQDKDTGERRLEAGAMVLADRGIVCIDEFDKMGDNDRVAIHEVMEQQTVTIAKAGIHTTLNARCSVIAAANPAYGQYIDRKKPFDNIALPDSLLSRFDLLFIVCDEIDEEYDRAISEHVLRMHRYIPPDLEEGQPINDSYTMGFSTALTRALEPTEEEDTEPFERYHSLLHNTVGAGAAAMSNIRKSKSRQSKAGADGQDSNRSNILKIAFVKKYIGYAKERIKPALTDEANEFIANTYSDLRNKKLEEEQGKTMEKTLPVTARMLETLIRLSTAVAKSRLSQIVTKADAETAQEILEFMLYKEVKDAGRKKKRRRVDGLDEPGSESDGEGAPAAGPPSAEDQAMVDGVTRLALQPGPRDVFDFDDAPPTHDSGFRQQTRAAARAAEPPAPADRAMAAMDEAPAAAAGSSSASARGSAAPRRVVDPARLKLFKAQLHAFREAQTDADLLFPTEQIQLAINASLAGAQQFDEGECLDALLTMQDANQVMLAEGSVVFI